MDAFENKANLAKETLDLKRSQTTLGGGESRQKAQHERGKMTARERLVYLLDDGSFQELDAFAKHDCVDFGMEKKSFLGDGVVTGYGTISGKLVYVFSQDFTVFGGSLSAMMAKKICKIQDLAIQNGAPVIGINDSGGARIQEGVASLGGYADIFYRNVQASGVVPQISLIMGPCAGGAVYSPAITDFIFMVDQTSHMFITGPEVIKTVTGEEVTFEKLGGSVTHARDSGVADMRFASEADAIVGLKQLLKYIPSSNRPSSNQKPEHNSENTQKPTKDISKIVPANPNHPYQAKDLIEAVVDEI